MALGSSLKEKNTKPVNQYPLPLEEKKNLPREEKDSKLEPWAFRRNIQSNRFSLSTLAEMVAKKHVVKPVHKIGKKTLEFLSKT